jgi:hypothetical protein
LAVMGLVSAGLFLEFFLDSAIRYLIGGTGEKNNTV